MSLDWLHYGFGDFVEAQGRRFGGHLAVTPDRRCADEWARGALSYAQLAAEVRVRQDMLAASGLRRGERIALWGDNSIAWLTSWIAAVASGLVVIPLNSRLTLPEVAALCKESSVRALIGDDPIAQQGDGRIAGLMREAADSPQFQGLDLYWMRTIQNTPASVLGMAPPERPPIPRPAALPPGVAMIQFTSGSTGIPKGVLVKEGAMLADGACDARRWMLDATDSVMGVLPLYHNAGAVFTAIAALSAGSTLQLLSGWTGGDGLSSLHDPSRISVVPGIDAILDDLASLPGKALPKLRLIVTGVTPAYCRRIAERFGVEVANTYGLTECSPTVATGDLRDSQECRAEFVGRPLPGLKVRIVDIATGDSELPAGSEGEIQVIGWATMAAYLRKEHNDKAWTRDGWLRTGDLGRANADGYFQFTGRIKELIRSGGENVSPREVEEVLQRHARVDRVAVISLPHPRFIEKVVAVLMCRAGGADAGLAGDVQAFCRAQLAGFKQPRLALRVDRLPETSSKKIDKLSLRAAVLAWLDGKPATDTQGALQLETLWDRDA